MKAESQVDVTVEKRRARVAGIVALVSVALAFAAIIVQLSGVEPDPEGGAAGQAEQYREFDDSAVTALIAVGLRVAGILLVIVVARVLYDAVRAREPSAPTYLMQLGIVAPVIVAVLALLGYLALNAVVQDFVDLPAQAQTNDRAGELSDDDTLLRLQNVGQIVAQIVFAVWLALISAAAMGVGLVPKFLGYFGYGAAAALVLAPLAGQALFLGWLGSVALLMLNLWPGGRPPAWESGKAEPATF